MKKIFFSLLAIGAIASCAKTEPVYTDGDSEIRIAPVTSIATKADFKNAIDGIQYPLEEEFRVNAYWDGKQGDVMHEDLVYLDNVVFTRRGQYWAGDGATYYWPKNGTLQFACYSPATTPGVTHVPADDKYTVTYTQSANTADTEDFMLAPITVPYTAQTATENVSVIFEHTMAWITIKVKAANATAAEAFTVKNLTINGVNTKADLEAKMADGVQYDEWSNRDIPAKYEVFNDTYDLTTTAEILENTHNGTVVIPQKPTTLTIVFDQNELEEGGVVTTPGLSGQTLTLPLELDDETDNKWHPGKHYIYTIVFDLDEILINPSVADWEDVVVEDKNDQEDGYIATASTEDELKAALAAKVAEIQLTESINLTSELAVDYNVAFVDGGFKGAAISVTGGVVSFENVAFSNGTTYEKESAVYVRNGNTNITFENCVFNSYKYEAIQYTSEDGLWFCVNNCTFDKEAYRDLHLQVNSASKAEVKITNNKFLGAADTDSYVTVYGFDIERMILANNVTETPANTTNVWISDIFDEYYRTLVGFAPVVTAPTSLTQSAILADDYAANTVALNGYDFDGNGHTFIMNKSAETFAVTTTKGFVTNLEVVGYNGRNDSDGLIYGVVLKNIAGDVVLNNVSVAQTAYALNTQGGETGHALVVKNSTLEGWTSFDTFATATFVNTYFKIGDFFPSADPSKLNSSNGSVKPYMSTVFENCTFDKYFRIDFEQIRGGEKLTFKNCNVDGVKLTATNVATYLLCCDSEDTTNPWAAAQFE